MEKCTVLACPEPATFHVAVVKKFLGEAMGLCDKHGANGELMREIVEAVLDHVASYAAVYNKVHTIPVNQNPLEVRVVERV